MRPAGRNATRSPASAGAQSCPAPSLATGRQPRRGGLRRTRCRRQQGESYRPDDTGKPGRGAAFVVRYHQLNILLPVCLPASVHIRASGKGRTRIRSDIPMRCELFRDMFADLSFYSNYDSQPAGGAAKDDDGIVTAVGARLQRGFRSMDVDNKAI